MNKETAIKALNNGATLHIIHKTGNCWVCTGGAHSSIHSIRRTTAEKIADMAFLNGFSSFEGTSVYFIK